MKNAQFHFQNHIMRCNSLWGENIRRKTSWRFPGNAFFLSHSLFTFLLLFKWIKLPCGNFFFCFSLICMTDILLWRLLLFKPCGLQIWAIFIIWKWITVCDTNNIAMLKLVQFLKNQTLKTEATRSAVFRLIGWFLKKSTQMCLINFK